MPQIDFSKGTALHRLYGHSIFVIEAEKAKKDERFIKNICSSLGCYGIDGPNDWRKHLLPNRL